MSIIRKYRFLIARRFVQIGLLLLFVGGNYFNWTILKGNYSSGLFLDTIPLTDPYAVLQILFSGFMAGTDLLIGAAIILLIYGFLFGRVFCSWICPINIIADAAIFTSNKLASKPKMKLSRRTRYGAMILGLILSTLLGISAFEAINPIAILHREIIFGLGTGWTIIVALFIFDVTITKHGWCGHLCPLGAFYSLISRFSLLKIKHNNDNCTNCMKCFAVCHEPQVLSIIGKQNGLIKSGECTNCGRCVEVCEDNALNFNLGKNNKINILGASSRGFK